MTVATVTKSNKSAKGTITLNGSKSIANRALIIRALCEEDFPIHKLSNSKDTLLMDGLLKSNSVTAYLSMQQGTQVLTGTERMKQRPIGVLVDALRKLGANIEYLENEGYPPLKIHSPNADSYRQGHSNQVTISAGTSSQYISALLMIAPTLPNGLELILDGEIVSRPYIEMTLNLMAHFSVLHQWNDNTIKVANQKYQPRPFTVEADWSGASYFYSIAALADEVDLQLNGLFEKSVQGETDRITALQNELAKVQVYLSALPKRFSKNSTKEYFMVDGKAVVNSNPTFPTYEDHRMAMAFAPLAQLGQINIEEPKVVGKSYPMFWEDISLLGFEVS